MALKTTLEQLEEVQTAISAVMKGQSGSWDGKQVTLANLSTLSARERELLERYNLETGAGGIKRNYGIRRRR